MKKISTAAINTEQVPQVLKEHGIEYINIDKVNWPDAYPYKPEVFVAAALCEDALLLHYKVKEEKSAAVETKDNGRVWEDSCCEFFCSFDEKGYYNIESNCIGRLKFAFGSDRDNRIDASKEILENIERWASEGYEAFSERHLDSWEVALVIPFSSFFAHNIGISSFRNIRLNVYKCGDKLSTPHYLSLAPIRTTDPDFHRPEFFVADPF
jgi:hypothetical protein